MAGLGTWALSDVLGAEDEARRTTATARVKRVDDDGTAWVTLQDGAGEFPATGNVASVQPGDAVTVRIERGFATITGNSDDPSASSADVEATRETARLALESAAQASAAASVAEQSAEAAGEAAGRAVSDAATAKSAAQQAQADAAAAQAAATDAATDAASAASSAQSAQEDAATASAAATSAQGSAATASKAAQDAQADASDAASAAQAAQDDATNAASSASQAAQSASTAQQQAQAATTAAAEAKADAKTAKEQAAAAVSDAATAKQAATEATATANGAVTALATVQGVVDQLETDVDELQVHVAMMDAYDDGHGGTVPAGLHVVPTGSGYFLVIANDGMYVYDNTSVLVTKFGESIDFSSTRPQRIGNDTAYVEFYDSDNDGVPDAIRISGTNLNTAISSVQSALQSKADNSTVQTLRSEYNQTKTTVSGHETRLTATESVANGVRADFDNLEIGGRNLIKRTDYSVYGNSDHYNNANKAIFANDRVTIQYGSEVYLKNYAQNKLDEIIPSGTKLVGTVPVYSQTIADGNHRLYVSPMNENATVSWVDIVNIPTGYAGMLTWTYTTTMDTYGFVLDFDTRNATSGDMVLGRVKLERGNKPTDWTPAPEDLETEVTSLKTDYATYKQTTTESLTSIGTTVQGIDGRVSTAESTITQHSTDIEAKVSKDGVIAAINLSTEESGGSAVKINADKVNITGAAVFSAINNDTGTTKINGGKVDADTLHVNAANIDGSLTIGKVDGLQGALDGKASTTDVANAAKRTYVSIVTTALDYEVGTATLEATLYVDGAATASNVTYEWLRDGSAVSGATNRTLNVIAALGLEHAYSCKVTYGDIPAETGTIDLKAQVAAAKTASNYIAADATGIRIANANPSTATTYQHQTATKTEFVNQGISTASFGGSKARIGAEADAHVSIDEDSVDIVNGNGETVAYAAEDKFYADKFEATTAIYLGDYSLRMDSAGTLVIGRRS